MENKNNVGGKLMNIVHLNKVYEPPINTWNKGKQLMNWGKDNNYPKFLLDMYNYKGSPLHTMLIDKKIDMISGQGFEDVLNQSLINFIEDNDLSEEIKKITFDYEIFNGFSFLIKYNKNGQIKSIQHIKISQLRYGLMSEKNSYEYFWYCKDWSNTKKYPPESIMAYNEDVPVGTQIFYYSQYNPSNIIVDYPIAKYSNSINSIETHYETIKFHLNETKTGYFPDMHINFATGVPTPTEQEDQYFDIEQNFSGTGGSKLLVTYSKDSSTKAEISKIDLNDSDKRFIALMQQVKEDTVTGSGIPPALVLLIAGKLGGTNESITLMNEFQKSYISPRQNRIEFVLNKLLKINEFNEKLILKKYTV